MIRVKPMNLLVLIGLLSLMAKTRSVMIVVTYRSMMAIWIYASYWELNTFIAFSFFVEEIGAKSEIKRDAARTADVYISILDELNRK